MPTQVIVININYGGASAVPPPPDITMHEGGDLYSQPQPPGSSHNSPPRANRRVVRVTRITYAGRRQVRIIREEDAAVLPPHNLASMHEEGAGDPPHPQPTPPCPFHPPPPRSDSGGWRRENLRHAVPPSQGGGRVRTTRSSAGENMRTRALLRPSAPSSTGDEGMTTEGGGFRPNLGPWSHRRRSIEEYAAAAAPLRFFAAGTGDEDTAPPPNMGLTKEEVSRFLQTTTCEGSDGRDDMCVICHGNLYRNDDRKVIGILSCTHRFHADCIGKWLQRNNVCPLCKSVGIQF